MQIEARYNECALARYSERDAIGLCIDDVCRMHCAGDRTCRLACTVYVAAASGHAQRLIPANGQSVADFEACLNGLNSSHAKACAARACAFGCDDDGTASECSRACATWLSNEPRSRSRILAAQSASGGILPMFNTIGGTW